MGGGGGGGVGVAGWWALVVLPVESLFLCSTL